MSATESRRRRSPPSTKRAVSVAFALCSSVGVAQAQEAPREPSTTLPAGGDTSPVTSSTSEAPKAQPGSPWGYDFAVTALLAEPFEGARSLGDWGYGVSLLGGAHFRDIPLSAGFDLSAIHWGQASGVVNVRFGDSTQPLEETRTDQTVIIGSWLRFEPTSWLVRPYLEGLVGLKLLNTRYSFAFPQGMGSTSAVTDQSTASNAGLGLGIDALLAHASDGSEAAVFATLGVRRLWGSQASFTRAPDTSSVNRTVSFDVHTNSTVILLGIAIHGRGSNQ